MADIARTKAAAMTREEARRLVGQIFTARFPTVWSQIDLEHTPVANYVVFREALASSFEASRRRLGEARAMLRGHGMQPLFLMDEEGGRVTQVSEFFPSAPSPRALGASLTFGETGRLYAQMSAYLARLGIDVNLAPCLDVNTEPMNPVIGTRSLARDAHAVGCFAKIAVSAMHNGTACVAKHFPGHGMTRLDSHLTLPVVHEPREVLETIHMAPFRRAIAAGVDAVMICHCHYDALEPGNLPASLSRQVVTGQLRTALGFQGWVCTDSMDMLAVAGTIPPEEAAILAFEAGCDCLLYTEYSERLIAAFDAVVDAAVKGRLREADLRKAVSRRDTVLAALASRRARADAPAYDQQAYTSLVTKARSRWIRVDGDRRLLPLAGEKTAMVGASPRTAEKVRARIPAVSLLPPAKHVAGATLILWLTEPLRLPQPLEELRAMLERAETSVVVTDYTAIAEECAAAGVRIVADDPGPYAEDEIIRMLFGA